MPAQRRDTTSAGTTRAFPPALPRPRADDAAVDTPRSCAERSAPLHPPRVSRESHDTHRRMTGQLYNGQAS
eukprot:4816528-Pleurochrysis_carterae.AAC.1